MLLKFMIISPSLVHLRSSIFLAAENDMTVGVSLGQKSLSSEFEDVQSSYIAKDLNEEFSAEDSHQSSQADSSLSLVTPTKRTFRKYENATDGDTSSTKLKAVKIED